MSDFKINPALCFPPEELARFIKHNAELEKPISSSTTHEIMTALIYRIAFEKEFGWKDYYIYFEPKESRQKELLEQIGNTLKMEDFVNFLSENTEQSSPYDVYFVRRNGDEDADVRPIQIKRFGKGKPRTNLAEQLIEYLGSSKISKYSKKRGHTVALLGECGRARPTACC